MGTTGADTFTSVNTAATTTYQAGDVLVGGDGADVLNITADNVALGAATSVIGIETINVTAQGTGFVNAASFNAGGVLANGVALNLSNKQLTNGTGFTVTALGSGATIAADSTITGTLSVTTTAAASQSLTLAANSAATQTVVLTHSGAADVATLSAAGAVGLTATTIETLNLSGNGAAATYTVTTDLGTTGTNLTGTQSVTIAGDGDLFQAKTVTDNTTAGTTTLKLTADTTAGADLSKIGADVIELGFASGAATYQVRAGQALKVSTANTAAITLDLNDNTTTNVTGAASVDLGVALHTSGLALDATASSDNITSLALTNSTAAQSFTLAAGALADVTVSGTKNLTLAAASTAKSINATGLSGVLTATANATNTNITGGSGNDSITVATATTVTVAGGAGNDTLTLTTDISGATWSGFEVLGLSAVTISKASQWNGHTEAVTGAVNVNISALDSSTIDLSGLQFKDATTFAVNSGSATVLDATKYTSTTGMTVIGSNVVDTIIGTANADTITGGNGADVITGGAGADTINLAETTAAIDTVIFAPATSTTTDTVNGFTAGTGGDIASISITAQTGSLIENGNSGDVAAAAAVVVQHAATAVATTLGATTNVLVLDATYANSAAVKTAIEAGGSTALTFATANTANDDFVLAWFDGTNTHLSLVNTATAATTIAAGGATLTELAVFNGVTASALVAGNFSFIA